MLTRRTGPILAVTRCQCVSILPAGKETIQEPGNLACSWDHHFSSPSQLRTYDLAVIEWAGGPEISGMFTGRTTV